MLVRAIHSALISDRTLKMSILFRCRVIINTGVIMFFVKPIYHLSALIIYQMKADHVLLRMICYFTNSRSIINIWLSNEWLYPISSCDRQRKNFILANFSFCTIPHGILVRYIQGIIFYTLIPFIWHHKCPSSSTNGSDMVLLTWAWCVGNAEHCC